MILGIDASNIRAGGGITHLSEVLKCVQPYDYGFKKVIVWARVKTLSSLCDQSWLEKVHVPILDGLLPQRIYWQQFVLPKLLERHGCDLLFSPGGTLPRHVPVPTVTMSQNLLPFDDAAISTYPKTHAHKKLHLFALRCLQTLSFKKTTGLIFLTHFARKAVLGKVRKHNGEIAVIPHGISERFIQRPRPSLPVEYYSEQNPFRLLYVSTIHVYKHQWYVAEAVVRLRKQGYLVSLDFVGSNHIGMDRLNEVMTKYDPELQFLKYVGPIPYDRLPTTYHQADGFVFASSCENMPNILIEAMASGLPIACSNRGPMPEVLSDAGVYFDPQQPDEMADSIRSLLDDSELRQRCAHRAFERAQEYSWARCARETFSFLEKIAVTKSDSIWLTE